MTGQPPNGTLQSWVSDAACRGDDPSGFLDEGTHEQTRAALATCDRCTVRQHCLQLGLAQPAQSDLGIWGGTTPEDRRQLRLGLANTRTHSPAAPTNGRPVQLGPPAPELPLRRDQWGVHHDDTGRVQVCELERAPRRMVLIDGHPVARTRTLADARRAAWRALHSTSTPTSAREQTRSRR